MLLIAQTRLSVPIPIAWVNHNGISTTEIVAPSCTFCALNVMTNKFITIIDEYEPEIGNLGQIVQGRSL